MPSLRVRHRGGKAIFKPKRWDPMIVEGVADRRPPSLMIVPSIASAVVPFCLSRSPSTGAGPVPECAGKPLASVAILVVSLVRLEEALLCPPSSFPKSAQASSDRRANGFGRYGVAKGF